MSGWDHCLLPFVFFHCSHDWIDVSVARKLSSLFGHFFYKKKKILSVKVTGTNLEFFYLHFVDVILLHLTVV